MKEFIEDYFGWFIGLVGFVIIVVLIVFFSTFGTVGAGNIGVKTTFGAVSGEIQPGLYFKIPFVQSVIEMDVQIQKEQVDASAASKDLQNVSAKVAVNYSVSADKVAVLYKNIGKDYQSRVIDPAIQEAVKSATAKYSAEELITKRPQVQDDIKASLVTRLTPQFINVVNVSIVDFDFSATFNKAIEAKVTAEQNALAAQNKLAQIKFEAEQTIATAKAQAEAIQIQAQAINSQGGADYVQLQAVAKWDGHLPAQMIPNASVPFLNLK